jgi:hypothetical protein
MGPGGGPDGAWAWWGLLVCWATFWGLRGGFLRQRLPGTNGRPTTPAAPGSPLHDKDKIYITPEAVCPLVSHHMHASQHPLSRITAHARPSHPQPFEAPRHTGCLMRTPRRARALPGPSCPTCEGPGSRTPLGGWAGAIANAPGMLQRAPMHCEAPVSFTPGHSPSRPRTQPHPCTCLSAVLPPGPPLVSGMAGMPPARPPPPPPKTVFWALPVRCPPRPQQKAPGPCPSAAPHAPNKRPLGPAPPPPPRLARRAWLV